MLRSMVAIAPGERASLSMAIKRNYGQAERPPEKGGMCAVIPGENWPLMCCVVVARELCGLDRYAKRSETEEVKGRESSSH